MNEKVDAVQRAADLLRGGATMMAETCPACGTPLFKIGSEITCPRCNKPVVIVSGAKGEAKALKTTVLENTERALLRKIEEVQTAINREKDLEKTRMLTETLTGLLNTLEKLGRN